jgi:hypothetical protein
LRLSAAACSWFVLAGVPYRAMPYARVSLPSALLQPGLLAVALKP